MSSPNSWALRRAAPRARGTPPTPPQQWLSQSQLRTRQSPRILDQQRKLREERSSSDRRGANLTPGYISPNIFDQPFFDDDPSRLPSPRPSPSYAAENKAASAAKNLKRLRAKISTKAAAREHGRRNITSFSSSLPFSKQPSRSRKSAMKHNDDDIDYQEEEEEEEEEDKEEGADVDEDNDDDYGFVVEMPTLDDADTADMVGRHREVFMQRAFGDDEGDANNKIVRPEKELNEIIFLLKHWEGDTALSSITDPDHYCALKEFRDTHKIGYKWVKKYWLHHIAPPGGVGEGRYILRRVEPKHKNGGRIVISRERVFDAIDEWHRERGHLGQERTHNFCRAKYYNCTQALVKIYCETCYVCMRKNPTVKPMKGSRKPIRSSGYRDRFQIDLIDFRKMRKRDPFGVLMRWIITVKDHSTGLTYISAIPRKTAHFVAHRLQELFGLIGYPSIFHTDNGKEFTARSVLKFLRHISPSIITVTGRPRKPSDQGSVESMNRLVKRLIGSELAQRRAVGDNPNWTEILGAVTASINSQSGRGGNSTSSYNTVFGQSYDQDIPCSMDEARRCWTVEERVKVTYLQILLHIIQSIH